MKTKVRLSVIITTYNWPNALHAVLVGLCAQRVKPDEVLIADDGSTADTKALLARWALAAPFPIRHVWHEDDGFQAAKIRNRAIARATHPYLVFMDGDCVPTPHFIKHHLALAEAGWFVSGSRILLSKRFTEDTLTQGQSLCLKGALFWIMARIKQDINRWMPMVHLPLGRLRYARASNWQGAKTCNLGLWRDDAIRVNGFDEQFTGWGYEDSDFVVRLINQGIQRKDGRHAATVWHLWHAQAPRAQAEENWARFIKRLEDKRTDAAKGINQYV